MLKFGMDLSKKSRVPLLLCGLAVVMSASLAWGEEDGDSPLPVVVKTKRASIDARSLPHLIELTETHSPNLQKARNLHDIAELNFAIGGKAWLPSLDLTTNAGLKGTDPNTRLSPWTSQLDLVTNETFYDNGVALTNYEILRRTLERSELEYAQARDKQLLDMTNAYFDWSATLQQREILENKRDLLRRQFNVLEAQYKQGLKTKRDVLRIETEMRRLELSVLSSDSDIDLNFQKLAAFVGMDREELDREDIEAEVAKPYVPLENNTEPLKAQNNRVARILALKEKEAALNTRLFQRNYWPQISLNGDVGYHNVDYIDYPTSPTWDANHNWEWSALVTLKYNFWDWGIRRQQLQVARIAERNVGEQTRQSLFDLGNDLRNVMLQIHNFRENVRMTKDLLVLEQQSYSILEAEYRIGRATYLDLITNLNSLIDARSKFIDSYFGFKKQQMLYAFHRGDLYENLKPK